jgi:hypothetical protein
MDRHVRAGLAVLASTVFVGVIACTNVQPEEKIVKDFFRASRIRDNAALGASATASFEPRTDGIVQKLSFVGVSPERTTPLVVKQYDEAWDKAKTDEAEFTQKKNAYQKENIKAIQRVVEAEGSKEAVNRADMKVQTEWNTLREEAVKHSKAVSDARVQLSRAKALTELSLSTPNGPTPDVNLMTGQMVAKDVTVDATIKTPEGETVEKQLVVTLERAVVTTEKGETQTGRWIVTRVKDAKSGKTS